MILWFLAYVMLFFHYIRFVGGLPPFVGALSPYADAVLDVKRHLLNEKDRAATCCTAGHWKHQYQSSSWLEIWKRSNGNLQPNSFIILMIILMATRACGRPTYLAVIGTGHFFIFFVLFFFRVQLRFSRDNGAQIIGKLSRFQLKLTCVR
jgi:hypothetical protein